MRAFVIADASKRKAKPIGILVWEADQSSDQGRFFLELSTHCGEADVPLSLSFLLKRKERIATPEESEDWARSRIVPEDRHNIVEVLLANNLAAYDEIGLLAASMGRSSDDDFLAYEIDLANTAFDDLPFDADASWADRIISATQRQRSAGQVHYAFVDIPGSNPCVHQDTGKGASRSPTEAPQQNLAQSIGSQIRKRRIQAGLTQKQLAAKAGITQSVLSRVESGGGNPTLSLLEEIATALDASMSIHLELSKD